MATKHILVVDDDPSMLKAIRKYLERTGNEVVAVGSATSALTALNNHAFDAIVTDWMMPEMSGIELIYQVRKTISPLPVIMVITGLGSEFARRHALETGADDFLSKPFELHELEQRLNNLFNRKAQPAPNLTDQVTVKPLTTKPPFTCVTIAASTGGPPALTSLLVGLPVLPDAATLVVLHSPSWALEELTKRLNRQLAVPVQLGQDGMAVKPGQIYIAPGEKHMLITRQLTLRLTDDPPENYVRPAADPLFRSAAKVFGKYCVGVVLTGMGRDGAQGCRHIHAGGGVVLVQNPNTAVARSMPTTALESNPKAMQATLELLPVRITNQVQRINRPAGDETD